MKRLIGLFLVIVLIIIGIGAYLGPDDLKGCGDRPSSKTGCQAAGAIVAVSGGDTAARARGAIALYKNGWAPKLVFSGAALDKSGPSNAAVMRREAVAAGVPDKDILIEEYSATTKQNAEKTMSIFEQNHITSVILVTSAYHQRRAGLEFVKRSKGLVAIRNHPIKTDKQWSTFWWATPVGWILALSELAKILAFYVIGTR